MNLRSSGLSNAINTIRKNAITTSWSQNSHYRDTEPLQHQKVSCETPLTSARSPFKGRSSFLAWGDAPRGDFTHTHSPNHLKDHQCCEEPLYLTPSRPKVWSLVFPSLRNSARPTSRLYIAPVSSGLLHAATASFCTCLGTAKQA